MGRVLVRFCFIFGRALERFGKDSPEDCGRCSTIFSSIFSIGTPALLRFAPRSATIRGGSLVEPPSVVENLAKPLPEGKFRARVSRRGRQEGAHFCILPRKNQWFRLSGSLAEFWVSSAKGQKQDFPGPPRYLGLLGPQMGSPGGSFLAFFRFFVDFAFRIIFWSIFHRFWTGFGRVWGGQNHPRIEFCHVFWEVFSEA